MGIKISHDVTWSPAVRNYDAILEDIAEILVNDETELANFLQSFIGPYDYGDWSDVDKDYITKILINAEQLYDQHIVKEDMTHPSLPLPVGYLKALSCLKMLLRADPRSEWQNDAIVNVIIQDGRTWTSSGLIGDFILEQLIVAPGISYEALSLVLSGRSTQSEEVNLSLLNENDFCCLLRSATEDIFGPNGETWGMMIPWQGEKYKKLFNDLNQLQNILSDDPRSKACE